MDATANQNGPPEFTCFLAHQILIAVAVVASAIVQDAQTWKEKNTNEIKPECV